MQSLKFKLGQSAFFIGPLQRYVNADVSIVKATENFETISRLPNDLNNVLSASIVTSGAGITLEYDSRNNFFPLLRVLNMSLIIYGLITLLVQILTVTYLNLVH